VCHLFGSPCTSPIGCRLSRPCCRRAFLHFQGVDSARRQPTARLLEWTKLCATRGSTKRLSNPSLYFRWLGHFPQIDRRSAECSAHDCSDEILKISNSRVSSVSTVTRLRIRWPRFDSRQRPGFFLFATASWPALGPIQPSLQSIPGVKRQERETDGLPLSSAEVKNACNHTATPA
jgi:hypothetical protein